MSRSVLLIVLDGFGIGDGGPADATAVAHTPFFRSARERYPTARIDTSGEAVGLPPGQMGNSEVGHMTMGAGRIIEQDMTRIDAAVARGELAGNEAIGGALDAVAQSGGTLHLMGLVSDGGVHSHLSHLEALLALCKSRDVHPALHAFLDGRDTPPRSGAAFLAAVMPHLERCGGHVATLTGRYYAMDRDNRWDRISQAYRAIVDRDGAGAPDASTAIARSYERGEGDEFVRPTVIDGGAPLRDGDAVIFFNFRADRARELTNAITSVDPESLGAELERSRVVKLSRFVCFTEYRADFDLPVAFPRHTTRRILGEEISAAGLSQLRIAETEKYAHVTFFFNGGQEEPFPAEERLLIPSPRNVATYDHKPEMSALEVTDRLLERVRDGGYGFVLLNFANPDMVGHTGVLDAAVKAVETIDACLQRITDVVLENNGAVLITADHGNCEQMVDSETGQPHTAHTTNPVPIYWLDRHGGGRGLRDGGLSDLAPTVLELLDLPVPSEMTGRTLIVPA
ncbi:MAG: 2,3-bisphosphoglycerate-independent phosphoglycerate mutase [Myxococcota bacterium]